MIHELFKLVMLFLLNNWRVVLMATIVAVLTAWGAFWKWRAGVWESRYETYRIEVAALGMAAEAKAKEKKATQDKTTKEVANASKTNRSRISSYYGDGLRLPPAGSGPVPAVADSPPRADESSAQCAPSDPDLERRAALDAEQVMAWQEWAMKQQLPVE